VASEISPDPLAAIQLIISGLAGILSEVEITIGGLSVWGIWISSVNSYAAYRYR
jgi:hypothetical protein